MVSVELSVTILSSQGLQGFPVPPPDPHRPTRNESIQRRLLAKEEVEEKEDLLCQG